jgi:hypothetical protein
VASCFIKKTGVSIWRDIGISHQIKIGIFKREVIAQMIEKYIQRE